MSKNTLRTGNYKNSECWYEHLSTLQQVGISNKDELPYLYHAHPCMTHLEEILKDTVFSPDESLQEQYDSYTVTKCCFKFGNLQIFCYMINENPSDAYWTQFQDIMKMIYYKVWRN